MSMTVFAALIPLLGWASTIVVQVIHAHLHAERTRNEIRLMEARRNLDDVIADVIAKVEADIAAGELEPDPIEVHHDPVGIDGSCIRVR